MNPAHGEVVLSGVSFRSGPNLDVLGVKFDSKLTFEDYVRGIVSRVSQKKMYFEVVKRILEDTSMLLRCYFAFVLPTLSIVLRCGGQLLNVTFSFSSARCIRWPGFVLIRVSWLFVIDVVLLG